MPQRIVDVLEMVEIQEHQRHRLVAALGQAQVVGKTVAQHGAVGQAGQQIKMRHPANALLVRLALAHVRENGDVVRGLAFGVVDAADGQPLRIHLAVLALVPDFPLPETLCMDAAPHAAA
jgi:hypothetical protein